MALHVNDEGKLHAIPGSEKLYPCTGVIVAVSQELGSNIRSHLPPRRLRGGRRGARREHGCPRRGRGQARRRGHACVYAVSPDARALALCGSPDC